MATASRMTPSVAVNKSSKYLGYSFRVFQKCGQPELSADMGQPIHLDAGNAHVLGLCSYWFAAIMELEWK